MNIFKILNLFTILLQMSVHNINYIFLFRPSYFYSFFLTDELTNIFDEKIDSEWNTFEWEGIMTILFNLYGLTLTINWTLMD